MEKEFYENPQTRVIEFLPGHRLLDNVASKPTATGDDWIIIED